MLCNLSYEFKKYSKEKMKKDGGKGMVCILSY